MFLMFDLFIADKTSNGPTPSTAPDANNNPSWRSTSMAIESLISDLQQ